MSGKTRRLPGLSLLVLAASLSLGATEANAGFFDRLFGGPIQKRSAVEFPPAPPAPKKQAAVAAQRISVPSYYTYKADSLARVDFAPLAAIAQSASLDAATSGTEFRAAVAGLDGYELFAERDIAKTLVEFYKSNPTYIWVSGDAASERAKAAIAAMAEARSYGLQPGDYAVSVPTEASHSASDLIRFEMALSARVLRYLRDANGGVVDPNRVSGYYDFPAKAFDMAAALKALAGGADPRATLEAAHPRNGAYKALRAELAALEASAETEIVVDPKLLLKPGETNPEFAKLLRLIARDLDDEMGGEHGETLARLGSSETYVDELVPVIKAVQKNEGLKPDGVIGPRTVSKLAGTSKAQRIEKVLIGLEQLRWHPSELGNPRVFINQPAYTASYVDGDRDVLSMRAVVGKVSNQTSFFFDEIEQVDYNPYWGVPQSIIVNEMLPRLRNDPGYLDRAGYEVTDAKGRRISSSSVNWGAYGSKVPFGVRQAPSEANALGELKILFPNKHAIYMHDTPQKALFDRDARAFSHGCVRLANPRGMAAAVLGTNVDHIAGKLAQGHSFEKVTRKIPVYVAYFTAWPNDTGTVEYFDDVYGRDARLRSAIDATEAARAPSS